MPAFLVHRVPDPSAMWDEVVAHLDRDDIDAPSACGERMADRLGAGFVVFDGCDHWWPLGRPAEVAAELETLWS